MLKSVNCSFLLQPLYGFGGKDPARFARAAGHQDLVYVHDPELTFEQVCMLACLQHGLHDTICRHSWLHDTCCLHSWPASYKLSNKVFHLKAVSEFRKVDSHSFLLSVVQFLLLC